MSDTTEVCANESLLRNAIIQKMVSGWNMAESFRLPETVPGSARIGKGASAFPVAVVGVNCSHATLPLVASTQESTPSVATPLEEWPRGDCQCFTPVGTTD